MIFISYVECFSDLWTIRNMHIRWTQGICRLCKSLKSVIYTIYKDCSRKFRNLDFNMLDLSLWEERNMTLGFSTKTNVLIWLESPHVKHTFFLFAELNYGIDLFYKFHGNCNGFEHQANLLRVQRSLVKRKDSLYCGFVCSDPRVPEAILAKYATLWSCK